MIIVPFAGCTRIKCGFKGEGESRLENVLATNCMGYCGKFQCNIFVARGEDDWSLLNVITVFEVFCGHCSLHPGCIHHYILFFTRKIYHKSKLSFNSHKRVIISFPLLLIFWLILLKIQEKYFSFSQMVGMWLLHENTNHDLTNNSMPSIMYLFMSPSGDIKEYLSD